MPEQMEMWDEEARRQWAESNPGLDMANYPGAYPLPFFLIVLGYALIFVFDKVVFDTPALINGDL